MSAFAIMRFHKYKKGAVTAIEKHNERKKEAYASNRDIDMERSHLNVHLEPSPPSYLKAVTKRIKDAGCPRIRRDSTYMVEAVFTASGDFFKDKSDDEAVEFFKWCHAYADTTFGEDNIISAVVHMDEKTPHMHFCFVPVTGDGRLSAKDILGNAKKLSWHQDQFYEFMIRGYPDLQRGQSAMETHRKHVPTWLLKQAPEMQKLFTRMEKTVEDITFYNTGAKKETLQKQLKKMLPQAKSFVTEVEKLKGSLEESMNEIQIQRTEIYRQDRRIEEKDGKISELEKKVRDLESILDEFKWLFTRIPPEILEEIQRPKQRAQTQKKRREECL